MRDAARLKEFTLDAKQRESANLRPDQRLRRFCPLFLPPLSSMPVLVCSFLLPAILPSSPPLSFIPLTVLPSSERSFLLSAKVLFPGTQEGVHVDGTDRRL